MSHSITADVDRGLQIHAEIEALEIELAEITLRLENAGLKAHQVDLKDADREGRRYLAKGSKCIIPIVFTADKIVGEFRAKTPVHLRIEAASGIQFTYFFRSVHKFENLYDDGKMFRARAAELLEDKAPAFITACLARDKEGHPKSDIKIQWDAPEPL